MVCHWDFHVSWLAPVLPALVGALVGGGITALTAFLTLRGSQKEDRRVRAADRGEEAASTLVSALTDVRAIALEDSGRIKATPEARRTIVTFRGEVDKALPALRGHGLENRLAILVGLLQQNSDELAALDIVDGDEVAVIEIRRGKDRLTYSRWIVHCLQDLAAGEGCPGDVTPPAPASDKDAQAWEEPPPPDTASDEAMARRNVPD